MIIWQDLRARGGPATEWTGPSQHFDWKTQSDVFASLTSVRGWSASVAGGDLPESLQGEQVTREYFDVAGTWPALGRGFQASDDVPNAPRVVILSHGLWTRRFGGDRSVIGRAIPINGESHEIIGVMPAGFTPIRVARRCTVAAASPEPGEPVAERGGLPHVRPARARCHNRSDAGTARHVGKKPPADAPGVGHGQGHQSRPVARTACRRDEALALHAAGRGGLRAAHRLRQHRQPSAVARVRAQRRNRGTSRAGGRSRAHHQAVADRERAPGRRRRRPRRDSRGVGVSARSRASRRTARRESTKSVWTAGSWPSR